MKCPARVPCGGASQKNSRDSARKDTTGQGSCSDRERLSPACQTRRELHQGTTSSNATHHHLRREPVRPENIWKRRSPVHPEPHLPGSPLQMSCEEEGSVLEYLVAFDVYPGDEDSFEIDYQVPHRLVAEGRFLFKTTLHDTVVPACCRIPFRGERWTI